MPSIQHKRGTRAALDAAATAGALKIGEIYLITDEDRIAIGTATNAYVAFAKESEPTNNGSRVIFTVLGDSLMPGRDNDDSGRDGNDPIPSNARVYVNDPTDGDYQALVDLAGPLTWPSAGDNDRISPIEHTLSQFNALSSFGTGFIGCAVGGSALDIGWDPATPGANLTAAVAAHNTAMALYKAEDPNCIVGSVLINLTSNGTPSGEAQWIALIDYVRANLDFVDDTTPIIISGPAASGTTFDEKRLDAEEGASARINCFVQHPPYPTDDPQNLHPTKAENRTYGAALGTLAYVALYGQQTIPTITTDLVQGSVQGQALNIAIEHSGLLAPSKYGVAEINGGVDASEVEIGGEFSAPTIVKTGGGFLANGVYNFNIRMRNSAWDYSDDYVMELTVADGGGGGVALTNEYGLMDTVSAWGSVNFPTVPVITGKNLLILFFEHGSSKGSSLIVDVDSNMAGFVAATDVGPSLELWSYESVIDTNVSVDATWTSHSNQMNIVNIGATGLAATPTATLDFDHGFNGSTATTKDHGAVVVPSGGKAILVVAGTSSVELTASSTGLTRIAHYTSSGDDNQIAVFERDDDGGTEVNCGTSSYLAGLLLTYAPE